MKKILLLAAVLCATPAFAGGWGNPHTNGNQGQEQNQDQSQDQDQEQGQAQGQGQGQGQLSTNINTNLAASGSASASKSKSKANATGGSSTSQGGASTSTSSGVGGDSGSSSTSGSNIDIDTSRNETANSAAAIYSVGCQVAGSAQTDKGGISLILDDVVCQSLKLADAHRVALKACGRPNLAAYSETRPDLPTISDVAECKEMHKERIHHYLDVAGDGVDKTAKSQLFAKNGINTGLGSIGFGILIYLLILI